MVAFAKLKLQGFKSFVDGTEMEIAPGLTGVVGPNGCGKSNIVEALRWVMGESSARQMRGGEMDDVIFGGTASRPPRNVAEVMLGLDNRSRSAPPSFNEQDEIEIVRRIERGMGSAYKVNGREVRARDVQLLFADSATGARSPALVSQGKVEAIISAKPADRRALLEEAAGISGLYTRRHEAELRLRAAEGNLTRLEDVLTALDDQLLGLKKQAKQASRYRNIGDQIRSAEARLLNLRWGEALDAAESTRLGLIEADAKVAELTEHSAKAAALQAEVATKLPPLRNQAVEAGAGLQRLLIAREQLDAEAGRLAEALSEIRGRLSQINDDRKRERALADDAGEALSRLDEEATGLTVARSGEDEAIATAKSKLDDIGRETNAIEADLSKRTEQVAKAEAERNAARQRLLEMEERVRRLEARRNEHLAARAQAESEVANDSEAQAAETKVTEAQAKLEAATAGIDGAAKAREATEASLSLAREGEATAQTELAKLRAEAKALSDLLAAGRKSGAPILDSIKAAPGYETALGAALGDDLEAPLDETSPRRWSSLAPYSEDVKWANGIKPLSDFIEAPPALARRLSRIGVVESAEMGAELRKELTPGQRLVTQKGDLWRWDGFTMVAGAPSAAAVRLAQRNRLEELSKRLAEAESKAASVREGLDLAKVEAAKAVEAERAARDGARNAERELAAAREALAGHHRKLTAAQSRLEAIRNAVTQSEADLTEAQTQREAARQAFEAIPDSAGEREKLNEFRAEVAEKRSALVEARAAHDRLLREAGERRRRAEAVAQEQNSWRERRDSATTRDGELIEREKTAEAEEARIANLPEEITFKRSTLLDQIALAEENRKQASDQLALAEAAQGEADRALRNVEQILSGAREERVRREALVEQAKRQCRSIAERIAERLECTPEELPNIAGINPDAELPPVDQLERRLERLLKERDDMGPVNLLAETEAQELDTRIAGLRNEREDLIAAIARLRQGIAELNREGRERLLASFKAVDDHFRELFVRLFGGGRAHLTLTESDDPLEAGLEIMASPPGKRLQSLSLLSGGEKALTALALIFAVFMTNPAPICVLDEVDAPLDDANVDRFCSLMEDLANNTATRFLVVTHHRMTMSRMDRLYGVTMAERGISRLVSVDLRAAEALQEGKPV